MENFGGALHGHGTGVEGVADHLTADHGHTGNACHIHHLVHSDTIVNIGGDALCLGDAVGDDTAEIGGVCAMDNAVEIVAHLFIHHKSAGGRRRQLTAAGTDGMETIQGHLFLRQHLLDAAAAEVHLIHNGGKGG